MLLAWSLPALAEKEITVFAAASLRGVIEEIAADTARDIRLSYGGSGTMARQVAAGAPADVVVLANALWRDWLVEQGIARAETTEVIAENRLVLIAPSGAAPLNSATEVAARLGTGRLAMGQRDAVPAGTYARQWLERAGIWDTIRGQLAETDNVRAALALVARGDVPLGVVYATDAKAEPKVEVVFDIPQTQHDPIQYFAAALTLDGIVFLTELTGPTAKAAFATHGFQPVTK